MERLSEVSSKIPHTDCFSKESVSDTSGAMGLIPPAGGASGLLGKVRLLQRPYSTDKAASSRQSKY